MERRPLSAGRKALVCALLATTVAGIGVWQGSLPAQEREPAAPSAAKKHAEGLSEAFRRAAEVAIPTVVTIETRTKPQREALGDSTGPQSGENPFKGTPFEHFFEGQEAPFRQFNDRGSMRPSVPRRQGMASGVIVDPSGVVLTNNHVVAGADEVIVRLSDGREFTATDIKTDPETDLAVLRIKGADSLPAAPLGDSEALRIGDWVIAVGNPFGLDSTVSAGIISGTGRELASTKRTRFLQTDAAINPGNSGGPLLNLDGEVIGINTAIASSSGGYQGIGFAIPSNLAKWVMGQLIEGGVVQRGYLGVGVEEVRGDLAQKLGVKRRDGVLVAEVYPDTPAAKAGFEEGDVITEFAGSPVRGPRDLQELVERMPLDSTQRIKLLRDGKAMELKVAIKPLPRSGQPLSGDDGQESPLRPDNRDAFHSQDLGIEVGELSAAQADQLGYKDREGVLVTDVDRTGLAAEVGITEGMLILKVGKRHVKNVDEFKSALSQESVKDGVLLLVRTENGNRFVVLQADK